MFQKRNGEVMLTVNAEYISALMPIDFVLLDPVVERSSLAMDNVTKAVPLGSRLRIERQVVVKTRRSTESTIIDNFVHKFPTRKYGLSGLV